MNKAIERRVSAAERRLSATHVGLHVITISGGFAGPIRYAQGGGRIWERSIDETFEAFEARVIADAKTTNLKQLIFGGLPPRGVELGTFEDFFNCSDFPETLPAEAFRIEKL